MIVHSPRERRLHPQHGVHRPRPASPARPHRSVRRTSSVDATRPEGLDGPLVLTGTARNLHTAVDGRPGVLGAASLSAVVDYLHGRRVTEIAVDPPATTDALIGVSASSGFRRALDIALPEHAAGGPLAYWLLDEVPVITLVSGFALSHESFVHPYTGRSNARPDLCAGWRSSGTIMVAIETTGRSPVPTGPLAPVLEADDPWSWHEMPPLPPYAVRRRRLLDVTVADGAAVVDVFFRDSHMADEGIETVVHEYGARLVVDTGTWQVRTSGAIAEVLPWVECLSAADSAGRLVGQDVRRLRSWVRDELTGVTTCTHLNDTLRGVADVPYLVSALRRVDRSVP